MPCFGPRNGSASDPETATLRTPNRRRTGQDCCRKEMSACLQLPVLLRRSRKEKPALDWPARVRAGGRVTTVSEQRRGTSLTPGRHFRVPEQTGRCAQHDNGSEGESRGGADAVSRHIRDQDRWDGPGRRGHRGRRGRLKGRRPFCSSGVSGVPGVAAVPGLPAVPGVPPASPAGSCRFPFCPTRISGIL